METDKQNRHGGPSLASEGRSEDSGSKTPQASLPAEPGTVELRADGSVTIAGHRIRLKTVFDALVAAGDHASLDTLCRAFPTVERSCLERVLSYIARHRDVVEQHAREEEEVFSQYAAKGIRIPLDELRQRADT